MTSANVAELKSHLSRFLALVEQGEEVEVCKRNVPVARLVPVPPRGRKNRTQLGCGEGTVRIDCDLTESAIPTTDWAMLQD